MDSCVNLWLNAAQTLLAVLTQSSCAIQADTSVIRVQAVPEM